MNEYIVTIDVTNIVECYLKNFMVVNKKILSLEHVFSVILSLPMHIVDMESYIYEALETIIDYPSPTDDYLLMDFYVGELLTLSDASPIILNEIENRAYSSYLNFINTNPLKSFLVIKNNLMFDYYDIVTINDNTFLLLIPKKED